MYTTQMDAARKGIFTDAMQIVAGKESMEKDVLLERMAKGQIIIPANKNHKSLDPEGIGHGLRTKINVNLGVSEDSSDNEAELEKVRRALAMGAESIMDLSNYGKTRHFRKSLMEISTAMIGTVPMYDVLGYHDKELAKLEPEDFFDVVKIHAEDGVDFLTIHVGMNRESANVFKRNTRLTILSAGAGRCCMPGWKPETERIPSMNIMMNFWISAGHMILRFPWATRCGQVPSMMRPMPHRSRN